MISSRRGFLRGLFAAPAIVAASSLMPLRGLPLIVRPPGFTVEEIEAIANETISYCLEVHGVDQWNNPLMERIAVRGDSGVWCSKHAFQITNLVAVPA